MMNAELTAALETIRPELLTVLRLFGLPENTLSPNLDGSAAGAGSESATSEGVLYLSPTIRIPGYRRCIAGAQPAGSASRRSMISAGKQPASTLPGAV